MNNIRKVINIDKKIFDKLKKYCNENTYKISKFVEKIILEKIEGK